MAELHIGIVDDDPAMLGLLTRLVRSHRVVAADRARLLLDLVRRGQQFDVIVSDLMMPEMTGADLYRGIVAADSGQATRMIFLTGGATTKDARDFIRVVPQPVIMKPFDREALLALIEGMGQRAGQRSSEH